MRSTASVCCRAETLHSVKVRQTCQLLFILFFVFFVSSTVRVSAGEYFFRADALTVPFAAIASLSWSSSLLFCAVLIATTVAWGRVFCGYVCPMGTMGDLLDKMFSFKSRYSAAGAFKYHLLLALAMLSCGGATFFWLFDPLNWSSRIGGGFAPRYVEYHWLFVLAVALLALHAIFGRRAFCRVLCPLGAALGVVSKLGLFKREFIEPDCIDCDLCVKQCRTGAIVERPETYDPMECVHCGHCVDVCPTDALEFHYTSTHLPAPPQPPRRAFLLTAGLAAIAMLGLRPLRAAHAAMRPVIRPPGSVPEDRFINLCIRCGSCSRVCPTSTLIPAGLESGLLAYQAPVFDPDVGGCLHDCNLCGAVCPTGAIEELSLGNKQGLQIGVASIHQTRCLAIGKNQPCLSCVAACPFEAVFLVGVDITSEWGDSLGHPRVVEDRCVGCALCQVACPVEGEAAITVAAIAPQKPLPPLPNRRRVFEPGVSELFRLP